MRSAKETYIPRFYGLPWNNKKWRILLYFSNNRDMIFAGRQYPFQAETALNGIKQLLLDTIKLTSPNQWLPWTNKSLDSVNAEICPYEMREGEYSRSLEYPSYYFGSRGFRNLNDIVKDNPMDLHFNDLLLSHVYKKPYYTMKTSIMKGEPWPSNFYDTINIGKDVLCPCCNKVVLTEASNLICPNCAKTAEESSDDITYCVFCGTRQATTYVYPTEEPIC